jgi:hypothetical protein
MHMHSVKKFCLAGAAVTLLLTLGLLVLLQQATRAAEKKSAALSCACYLTKETYDGSQALFACAAGYHMASLWGIREPSNLRYDTALELATEDSGSGPPTGKLASGRIRTGLSAVTSGNVAVANCNGWSNNASIDFGAAVDLSADWGGFAHPSSPMAPWESIVFNCDNHDHVRVWCLQV